MNQMRIDFPLDVRLPGAVSTSKGDICRRGCFDHGVCRSFSAYIYLDPHAPGRRWYQLELRRTGRFI